MNKPIGVSILRKKLSKYFSNFIHSRGLLYNTIGHQKEAGGAAFYSWLLVDQNSNGWDTGDELDSDSFTDIGPWVTMSMDASSLTDQSDAVTFRAYLGSDGTGAANGINVDNFELTGTTVIPEPASLGLFGIVCGMLWFVRRKLRG